MPFAADGTYTPPTGAENAFAGKVIASATWNAIFIDIATALTNLSQGLQLIGRKQRSAVASPIVIVATDSIVNVNISAGSPTCTLPAAASRSGFPLTFKDVGPNFAAHNLTITPNGAEMIDGRATLVLNGDHQGVTLYPFNDGVNTGWMIL